MNHPDKKKQWPYNLPDADGTDNTRPSEDAAAHGDRETPAANQAMAADEGHESAEQKPDGNRQPDGQNGQTEPDDPDSLTGAPGPGQQEQSGPASAGKSRPRRKPVMVILDLLILAMAITGIYLVARPMVIHWQQDRLSSQLIDNFEQGDGTIEIDPDSLIVEGEDIEYVEAYETFGTTKPTTSEPVPTPDGSTAETSGDVTAPTPSPTPKPARVTVKAIARIKIPSINVDMPVAEGATVYNLRVAIGHHTPTADLGQPGRSVLFGHRMYTYGRHFNRLGEMKIGDTIVIEDKNNRYTYTVDQIDRILPSELIGQMYAPAEGSRIMLVTCDPVRVASHRLLVKGELTATEPKG